MATVARDGHSVLTGRRALIVNDSADGVETLCELLELCGYEVSVAWNGDHVLRLTPTVRPHLVVVDAKHLGDATLDIIRRMKADDATVTIVAIGSRDGEASVRAAGADWFVVKPDSETLQGVLVCVREQLDRRR